MAQLAARSIRTKLPLAVVALILIVSASVSTAAFLVIRRTLNETAGDRLQSLGLQFQEQFKGLVAASQARYAEASRRPELAAYLADPSSALEPAATQALRHPLPMADLTIAVELRDDAGRVLLSTDERHETVEWKELSGVLPADHAQNAGAAVAYGRLRTHGSDVRYPVVVRIAGAHPGYWVAWRRLSNNANNSAARAQLAAILGSEAALYVANADGTSWANLGHAAEAPDRTPAINAVTQYARPGSGTVLAAAQLTPGTPWMFTIEIPTHAVQAPARRFLRTVIAIAAGCTTLAMFVAWIMSRRLTAPLERLTVAADAVAAGDTARRVDESRHDEIGRLAQSFNAMAAEVQEARERLERLVETRTGELRTAQESLARREKLALVGHLAGGIGHEIRNPLGVMANAIYCLEAIQPDASPEVKEYLGILRRQVDLSAKIVNDLLDLSRTTPANRQPVSIRSVVNERLARVPPGIADVKADVPADLPNVHVDPVHAGQVLDNLLSNAVQALEGAPGTVSVRARAADTGFVEIAVSDTGRGIRPENMSKIFEPLFTTKARGIGLGLALSKTLAQANGGDLTLVSEAGESATFVFSLPVVGGMA